MSRSPKGIDLSTRVFIKQLNIKNYKCFKSDDCAVAFNVPDGTPRSGLTILVGANGVGKTSILEALNLVTESVFTIQNRLTAFDFHKEEDSLRIHAEFDKSCDYAMPETYRGSHFSCIGVVTEASFRDRKSPGRLLSHPLQVSTAVTTADTNYTQLSGKQGGEIEAFHKVFDESKLAESINIFYFDKARVRQISSGTFKTTFDRIVDDLNWKFLKGARNDSTARESVQKLGEDFETKIFALTDSPAGKKPIEETKKFFGRDDLGDLAINLFPLQWPFGNAFFAAKEAGSLAQIPIGKLGSGIEMVFTLHLLRAISEQAKGSIIYLLDEPELSLHPQAQRKLLELLVEEAKTKQVIIATHSAHFVDPSLITKIVRLRPASDGRIVPYRVTDTSLIGQIQEERKVFFRRHRDLFFTDQALFVEGIDDYERYGAFCERNKFPELADRLVMMNGADATFASESLCNQLGISFAAIVDKDFAVNRSFWARERNRSYIARVVKFIREKGINFDEQGFQAALAAELQETPRTDDRAAETYTHGTTTLLKVKNKHIFVLQKGEVTDYLNEQGEVVDDKDGAKKRELIGIFDAARKVLVG